MKEAILNAVAQHVRSLGLSGFSVDDIASDLSISKKTFYKHFKSKEDALSQLTERMMGSVRIFVEQLVASDLDFVQKLNELMRFMGSQVGKFSKIMQHDMQRHNPSLWKRVEQFRRERILENFSRLIEQGVSEGYVRKDVNKRIFLLAYMSTIEAIMQPNVLAEEPFSAHEALRSILALFFEGVLTKSGKSKLEDLQRSTIEHSI